MRAIVDPIRIIPHPQELGFKGDDRAFIIDARTVIVSDRPLQQRNAVAFESLNQAIAQHGIAALTVVAPDSFNGFGRAIIIGDIHDRHPWLDSFISARDMLSTPPTMKDEEYRLDVDSEFVVLIGESDAAIYWGVQTLIQLIKPSRSADECQIVAARIRDFPDMPLRSAFYGFHFGNLDNDSLLIRGYNDIIRFSKYKFNMIGLDNPHYGHLEMPIPDGSGKKYGERLAELFDFARKYHLQPRVGGMARWYSRQPSPWSDDLTLLEGIRTTQRITMIGNQEYPLKISSGQIAYKVIHDFKTGQIWLEEPVVVTDSLGKIVYNENRDFKIVFGRTEHPFFTQVIADEGEPAGYPLRRGESDESPTTIQRTENSRIQDGQTVRVTFSYIGPDPWSPYKVRYCRSDPRIHTDGPQNFIWRWCTQPVQYLGARIFNLEMDEIRVFGWDKRCQDSGKSRSQIFVDDVKYYYDTIKRYAPEAMIFMWSDMADPNHHARDYRTEEVADGIIASGMSDIVMVPWNHTCANSSIDFFFQKGFSIMASSQATVGNVSVAPLWAKLLRDKFDNTDRRYGLMHAPWEYDYATEEGEDRLATAADHAWSIAPYIIHLPVRNAKAGDDIPILAQFEGDRYVFDGRQVRSGPLVLISARIYFRTESHLDFQQISMKQHGKTYVAIIPAKWALGTWVEYYIEMADSGHISLAPKSAPDYCYRIKLLSDLNSN
ncbi:MAG: beta-N-acetylhexosaminidase [candidate division KSB1 bacterium]|nr:beta-N-acetylhexosaminidase [candidate division KSB1 bacterium]